MQKVILAVLAVAVIGGAVFADCALDAYKKACASCSFDANGKIDQSCSAAYKSSGLACISASYPIMSAKYSAGECPEVDACASQLSSCIARESSGNDKVDCEEGVVAMCYYDSDVCVKKAAFKCGEVEKTCPGSSGLILLALAFGLFAHASRKNSS